MGSKIAALTKVTVITVVYNAEKFVESTIKDVLRQSYSNVEFVVIDGGSIDNTLNILRRYELYISILVSEPDLGIYDAMNKGVALATGDWIVFMNAGDKFANPDVITTIFSQPIANDSAFIYGDVIVDYGDFKRLKKAGSLVDLKKGMQFSHQSLFARNSALRSNPFNIDFRLAADFDLVLRGWSNELKFEYVHSPLSIVSAGGVSDLLRLRCIREWESVVNAHLGSTLRSRMYFLGKRMRMMLIMAVKKTLPSILVSFVQRVK